MAETGSSYRSTLKITDINGVLVDAVSVVLTVTAPDGTVTTPTVSHDSTGSYRADIVLSQEGLYKLVWTSTSPNTIKTDYVPSNVFRSIISIDEARNAAGYVEGDNDNAFRQVMAAATELVEGVVGACVQRTITNERVVGSEAQVIRLAHAPLPSDTSVTSVTSVWPFGPSWTTNDFLVYPDSGTVELASMIYFWRGPWKATYTCGRLVVSQSIQLAVKEIIYDLWSTYRPYGAGDLEPGPEDTARFEQMLASYTMPPHAALLLESEAQPGFA